MRTLRLPPATTSLETHQVSLLLCHVAVGVHDVNRCGSKFVVELELLLVVTSGISAAHGGDLVLVSLNSEKGQAQRGETVAKKKTKQNNTTALL